METSFEFIFEVYLEICTFTWGNSHSMIVSINAFYSYLSTVVHICVIFEVNIMILFNKLINSIDNALLVMEFLKTKKGMMFEKFLSILLSFEF